MVRDVTRSTARVSPEPNSQTQQKSILDEVVEIRIYHYYSTDMIPETLRISTEVFSRHIIYITKIN
jgi:hypothetical protein